MTETLWGRMGRTKQTARKTGESPHADKVLSPAVPASAAGGKPKKARASKEEVVGESLPKPTKIRAPKKEPTDPAAPQPLFAKSVFVTGRNAAVTTGSMAKQAIDRHHNGDTALAKDVEQMVLALRTIFWSSVVRKSRAILEARRAEKAPLPRKKEYLLATAISQLS